MITIEDTLAEAQKNNRICPQPQKWNELYEMLPNKKRKGSGFEPSLPLILAAWRDTPAMMKMLRLKEHIEWASTHDCLSEIHQFLANLRENEWHHIGE
jgi:hypothetical protein